MSHNTNDFSCPGKVKLKNLSDEALPPEVIKYEQELEESETDSTQVEVTNLSVINTVNTGLNTLKPVPT